MLYALLFLAGFAIGVLITKIILKSETRGDLYIRINDSDKEMPVLVALDESPEKIGELKHVTFRVSRI